MISYNFLDWLYTQVGYEQYLENSILRAVSTLEWDGKHWSWKLCSHNYKNTVLSLSSTISTMSISDVGPQMLANPLLQMMPPHCGSIQLLSPTWKAPVVCWHGTSGTCWPWNSKYLHQLLCTLRRKGSLQKFPHTWRACLGHAQLLKWQILITPQMNREGRSLNRIERNNPRWSMLAIL